MTRRRLYKIYLSLLALLICHAGYAQETKLSKSIDKSFEVADRLNLEITNKYGSVIVDTWTQNEVSLRIEILAYGKDESAAEKLMDRVEFDFKYSDDFLEVESIFDRKKSFFKDLINAVSDYSASLLSKHKLQVNYEIMIPESTSSVTIENRFGDVHLGDIEGRANLTIAHGDIRVNRLVDYSKINLNYGNAKIKEIDEANISIKGAELELEFANKLNLTSSSSDISIGDALVIDLESTNDKINIDNVRDISGTANFTEVKIYYLGEICRLNQSYGSTTIKHIPAAFKTLRLTGKSTDFELYFSDAANFSSKIYARDDKLTIKDFAGKREKQNMDDKSKFVQITGDFGSVRSESKLNIDAQNGEVYIDFKGVSEATYNK